MTPYILLLFHILSNASFETIISDRVIDTAIGSVIASGKHPYTPAWEQEQISTYMQSAINSNKNYFSNIAAAFTGNQVNNTAYKLSRKMLCGASPIFPTLSAVCFLSQSENRKCLVASPVRSAESYAYLAHCNTVLVCQNPMPKSSRQRLHPAYWQHSRQTRRRRKMIAETPADHATPETVPMNCIQQRMQNCSKKTG